MALIKIACKRCGKELTVLPCRGPESNHPQRFCDRKCASNTSKHFWDNVRKSGGCWEWIGSRHNAGYGLFGPKRERAHRIAFEERNGPIPDGLWVLHKCDNPPCVNPDHLFLGTASDNMTDKMRKGRCGGEKHRGENSRRAKVKEADIWKIRERRANGETLAAIANDYGISPGNVWHISKGATWKHVT